MATIDAIQKGLKDRLATISGLHAQATEIETVQPPQAYPRLVSWAFSEDFDDAVTYVFDVWVLVNLGNGLNRAQTELNPYLSADGTKSLKAAIEADETLGGIVNSAHVTGGGNYGQANVGEQVFLAGSVRVEVYA